MQKMQLVSIYTSETIHNKVFLTSVKHAENSLVTFNDIG